MGIRAKINLTNAIDDELVNRGLLAPRLLRVIEAEGLVDTGAVSLVIPVEMASQLGLRIIGQRKPQHEAGSGEVIGITGAVIVECLGRKTVDEALVVGNDVLIGQVILLKLDLLVDCRKQQLFVNPQSPDYHAGDD